MAFRGNTTPVSAHSNLLHHSLNYYYNSKSNYTTLLPEKIPNFLAKKPKPVPILAPFPKNFTISLTQNYSFWSLRNARAFPNMLCHLQFLSTSNALPLIYPVGQLMANLRLTAGLSSNVTSSMKLSPTQRPPGPPSGAFHPCHHH